MAHFFSLDGSGDGSGSSTGRETPNQQQHNEIVNPWGNSSVILYRNEEIYQKGFEVWQQYMQTTHQHPRATPTKFHHQAYLGDSSAGSEPGAGPSSRSVPYSSSSNSRGMKQGALGGGINCQDCGNQAKKNCAHLRCRACCKNRGFDCPTHVKSTWVPASKRRERQQQLSATQQQHLPQQSQQQQLDVVSRGRGVENQKRQRENRNIGVPCSRLSTATLAGLEVGRDFPAELSSPAVFRCVRVSSVDDAEGHLAYQTAVSIGGHVFKGILYDQGPEARGGQSSSGGGGGQWQQHHPLTGSAAFAVPTAAAAGNISSVNAASETALLDPTIYSTSINDFLAGTQFFPSPRS
ncbi:hypothetical protein Nepgr_015763 [Nepenthes gracilis]|uniref:Uncharacterized protein n=1 Tax=Nepenthes gracilis TaxID=150966 RepID=A0AAD3SNU9_NEPGR|nr:hypothetical protein Nepgr_015763 [Nepenthes gracilis]